MGPFDGLRANGVGDCPRGTVRLLSAATVVVGLRRPSAAPLDSCLRRNDDTCEAICETPFGTLGL